MPTFQPPTAQDVPQYDQDASQRQIRLMRHFRPHVRGINVFVLSDGTYVLDTAATSDSQCSTPAGFFSDDPVGPDATGTMQPTDDTGDLFPELQNTNVPYPWNPFPNGDPPGQYFRGTNWDGSVVTAANDPYIVSVFYGGHENEITQEEALALTAIGFGDCIS